jgi:uncharacterized protein YbbC (DUF1343 family)
VINQTSVLPDGTPLVDAIIRRGWQISAIFVPEHGLSGQVVAGMTIKDDHYKNIPVYSLYGITRKPLPQHLSQVDVLVYDIQDVGTRFYTYITTLKYVIESAAPAGIPVYVLDRPNPIGGHIIEGPCLSPEFESFIGAIPIPVRYGMTIGELALMMKGEGWVPASADLHVVPIKNWKRSLFWDESGLPWISPSPNIPSAKAALLFPGVALLGGVGINGGVGTENPFLQFGAPWLDTDMLLKGLPPEDLRGIKLKTIEYTPNPIPGKILSMKYQGQTCKGVLIEVTEPGIFCSLRFSLSVLAHVLRHHQKKISLAQTELNRLFGTDHLSRFAKGELSLDHLLQILKKEEDAFRKLRQPYLLYE